MSGAEEPLAAWFAAQGWQPIPFQREVWRRYLAGESGLLHTPTGSGKTLAAFGGGLIEALAAPAKAAGEARLKVLWITPLRALAVDTTRALRDPITALGLDWQVAMRTGDASSRDKRLAREGKAEVLVITPESLALLLSYPDTAPHFRGLRCVIVDEWHELLGNKRGVLLQLGLARLRAMAPAARCWGLSATLGNLDQARRALLPHLPEAPLVGGVEPRKLTIRTLLPTESQRLPWAGHLGISQLPAVLRRIFSVRSSLLFTNTRSQAELWYEALARLWAEDTATLALHHGSLDPALRAAAEQGLRDGTMRCVVATSSLDLGVDFPAVDQVMQIGSPKGVARLLQRAGRAKHRPGEAGEVICVPAQALELLEYAAAREVVARGEVEARPVPLLCLDVLAQHCVTLALGGGFDSEALYDEVCGTYSFADLDRSTWRSVLDFIVQGGQALNKYPDFCRVVRDEDGTYRVHDRRVSLRHRLSIGTITADGSMTVRMLRGGVLGTVEESFVGRLRPGDQFRFAGRLLELVRLEGMTAHVRKARSGRGAVATWQGGRMPLSTELGREVERLFAEPPEQPELQALATMLALQEDSSALPAPGRLLVETVDTQRGQHLFLYPFAGRTVHEGLAALLSLRWGRLRPNTFTYTVNDYGLMLTPAEPIEIEAAVLHGLLTAEQLLEDLRASLNLGELARRQFREIARISGLLTPSLPGQAPRSLRQVQASSGLIFDVLRRYDPEHILLSQADRELFEAQLEITRLTAALRECARRSIALRHPEWLTPLSFPLWAEGFRGEFSTEDWQTRVRRAAEQLEKRYARAPNAA